MQSFHNSQSTKIYALSFLPDPYFVHFPISLFSLIFWTRQDRQLELPEENFIWAVTAGFSLLLCVCACSVCLFAAPWTVAHQAPLSMGFSRQEYWSGLPFSSPEDLPDPGIEPESWVSCIGRQILSPYHHLGSPQSLGAKWSHSNEWDRYVNTVVSGKCLHRPRL